MFVCLLDVQKAKCKVFSIKCLISLSNYRFLSFFPGTFHFAEGFVFGRFCLLEENEYSLVKGRFENLVPTCLKTLSGNFPFYDCFGGLWLPGEGLRISLIMPSLSLLVA